MSIPAPKKILFIVVVLALFIVPMITKAAVGGDPVTVGGDTTGSGSENSAIKAMRENNYGLDSIACKLGLVKCADGIVTEDSNRTDLKQVFMTIVQLALGFTSIIALAMVVYGGFMWATAAGSSERVDKGKKIIMWALIGVVVIMAAWGIITLVMSLVSSAT